METQAKIKETKQFSRLFLEEIVNVPLQNLSLEGLDEGQRKQVYGAYFDRNRDTNYFDLISDITEKGDFYLIKNEYGRIKEQILDAIHKGKNPGKLKLPGAFIQDLCKEFKDVESEFVGAILSVLISHSPDKEFSLDFSGYKTKQADVGVLLRTDQKLNVKGNIGEYLGKHSQGTIIFEGATNSKTIGYSMGKIIQKPKKKIKNGKIIFVDAKISPSQIYPNCMGEVYIGNGKQKIYPQEPEPGDWFNFLGNPDLVHLVDKTLYNVNELLQESLKSGIVISDAPSSLKRAKKAYHDEEYLISLRLLEQIKEQIEKRGLEKEMADKAIKTAKEKALRFGIGLDIDIPDEYTYIRSSVSFIQEQLKLAEDCIKKGDYVRALESIIKCGDKLEEGEEDFRTKSINKRCPACGKQMSVSENNCPVCNHDFKEKSETECPVCGSKIQSDATRCPVCEVSFEEKECKSCGAMIDVSETKCPICEYPDEEESASKGIDLTKYRRTRFKVGGS